MEALGDLKTYGTFNQSAPLDRLVGAKKIYSIDLKAATDRWPLLIQLDLLKSLFGHEFADEVGNLLGFTIKKTGICKSKSTDTDYRSCPLANSNSDPKADSGHRGRLARAQKGRPETASKAFANFPSQAELWVEELLERLPRYQLNGDAQGHSAFPEFLRPLAYGSGQAVLPFTLFEGLNSRDEKKGLLLKLLTPSTWLPDPGPGIVLALHPTHMIETDVCLPLPTNLLPVLLSQDV
ncbi:hypothetical protein V6N11_018878 [Hibiscus sabdariffa]|uniref:Uncharacterized protein n=1 Tax=Hibiscus sabdariffa TaxID=183260 RepID=A0ABR2N694_9ROSI